MTPEFADAIRRKRRIRRALRVEAIIGYLAALGLLVLVGRVGYDAVVPLLGSHIYLSGHKGVRITQPCEIDEHRVLNVTVTKQRDELLADCVAWETAQ
jgi:hypothetical protein